MPKPAPVILIPGLLCDALLWAPQIVALADVARCWVPDHARHDTVADIAHSILTQAPFAQFSLAGLSMGGYVALEIMRQAPSRVERLALLDTSPLPDTPEGTKARHDLIALWASRGADAVITAMLPKLVRPDARHDPMLGALVRTMALNTGYDGFVAQQTAIMHRPDSQATLASIACPTLVLCGAQDVLTPPDLHTDMARQIPGAQRVLVENAGHLSTLEQPQAVSDALRTWLA